MPDGPMIPRQALELLAEVVASQVLLDAVEASRRLTELQIPHALIGGLAVGIHGHPRATKDVDFLVDDLAFERVTPLLVYRGELRDLVRIGVIDLMPVPAGHSEIAEHLRIPKAGEIPVISPEVLVLLKLRANRAQDRADIIALIDAGLNIRSVTTYLRHNAPALVPLLAELVAEQDTRRSSSA